MCESTRGRLNAFMFDDELVRCYTIEIFETRDHHAAEQSSDIQYSRSKSFPLTCRLPLQVVAQRKPKHRLDLCNTSIRTSLCNRSFWTAVSTLIYLFFMRLSADSDQYIWKIKSITAKTFYLWSFSLYQSTPQPPRPHLITDDVWSKRGNINTAALVTIAQCNTLVARCSRQLTLGPLRCD